MIIAGAHCVIGSTSHAGIATMRRKESCRPPTPDLESLKIHLGGGKGAPSRRSTLRQDGKEPLEQTSCCCARSVSLNRIHAKASLY